MTIDEWVKKYEGKTVGYPTDKDFYGECLSLAKWYIKDMYGINPPTSGCNGARCYWSVFNSPLGTVLRKVPNTPDLIPLKGWIAVWNGNVGGGAGHIATVLEANINTFVSLDQNWNGKQAHKVTHNYTNVEGFLAPLQTINDNMSDELKECLAQHTRLVDELTQVKKQLSDLGEEYKKVLLNINNCQREKSIVESDLKLEVQAHKERALELSNLKEKYDKLISEANQPDQEVDKLLQRITTLENSIAGFKGEITKKDKEILELTSTIESLESLLSLSIVGILHKILTKLKGLIK